MQEAFKSSAWPSISIARTALHRHFLSPLVRRPDRHPSYTNLSSPPRQRSAENPALTDNSAGAERATPTENKQPVAV